MTSQMKGTASAAANAATPDAPLLRVDSLALGFNVPGGDVKRVVDGVSFELAAGQSLAVVGESGSGKTLIGKTLLGLLPDSARVLGGGVSFGGAPLLAQGAAQWRATRGTGIGMVFQEPMVSLNPAFRIGVQLTEALMRRRGLAREEATQRALAMLERVYVRNPRDCMKRYPHEFSGGMRQRIVLASAMLLRPKLLIADEPTTALDCVVQKEVLDVMMELTRDEGTALIFISHNLALVAAYTERVLVMRAGTAVETGTAERVLSRPAHPYTRALLEALPKRPDTPPAAIDERRAVLEMREVAVDYAQPRGGRLADWFKRRASGSSGGASTASARRGMVRTVFPTSFRLHAGETLAIVGESGSGKTTLAKVALGLVAAAEGQVLLDGATYLDGGAKRLQAARRAVQIVFQDPYSALDPRMRVGELVAEGLRLNRDLDAAGRAARVATVLADVGLGEHARRFVHELSGGQRQRVAIARALVSRPAVIIADEPVSALDVTVQKQVLDLFTSLQARYGFACLLISHDLGVVEQIASRVLVMLRGHLVELGTRAAVFDDPCHPYTRRLLRAVPELHGDGANGFRVMVREVPPARGEAADYFDPDGAAGRLPTLHRVEGRDGHWVARY
ncbi:dipeptide ABC transporter ATP-binding protein [Burkholderia plantarii]|uniref:ABC transporter, ATP-binding protein n=1 Tax=Burkholderia plantarii TaxID=41899 RepID=A0A0B6RRH6_BURPL|nr:ABC transporter ATP-binding protein [Burkholderia plantarii]AJK45983.1 ABC transporter, ATP-binding protein [Burkholderia plantarii]